MNVDAIRDLYEYHFTINRKLWDQCVMPLTDEQFKRPIEYSVGSVRNQVVHMLNVDDRWFSALRGEPVPGFLNPVRYHKRDAIREMWDGIEARMRDYLATLHEGRLLEPLTVTPTKQFQVWQVLMQVINHGTDHRAQLLALLHQLGVKTMPQDYYFYLMGQM